MTHLQIHRKSVCTIYKRFVKRTDLHMTIFLFLSRPQWDSSQVAASHLSGMFWGAWQSLTWSIFYFDTTDVAFSHSFVWVVCEIIIAKGYDKRCCCARLLRLRMIIREEMTLSSSDVSLTLQFLYFIVYTHKLTLCTQLWNNQISYQKHTHDCYTVSTVRLFSFK